MLESNDDLKKKKQIIACFYFFIFLFISQHNVSVLTWNNQ